MSETTTWWRTCSWGRSPIEPVQILRRTKEFVVLPPDEFWRKERREAIGNEYHETYEAARAHIIRSKQSRLDSALRAVEMARAELAKAEQIPESAPCA